MVFFVQKVMTNAIIFAIIIFIDVVTSHPLATLSDDDPTRFQLFSDGNQNGIETRDEKGNPGRVTRNTVFIAPNFVPIELDNRNHEGFIVEKLSDIEYDDGTEEEEIIIDIEEIPPGALADQYFRRSNLEKRDSGYPEEFSIETGRKKKELQKQEINAKENVLLNPIVNLKTDAMILETTEMFPKSSTTTTPSPIIDSSIQQIEDLMIKPPKTDSFKKFLQKIRTPAGKNIGRAVSKIFLKLNRPKSTSKPKTQDQTDERMSSSDSSALNPSLYAELLAKNLENQQIVPNESSGDKLASRWKKNPFIKYLLSKLRRNPLSKKFYLKNQLYPLLFKYRHKK